MPGLRSALAVNRATGRRRRSASRLRLSRSSVRRDPYSREAKHGRTVATKFSRGVFLCRRRPRRQRPQRVRFDVPSGPSDRR